MKDKLEQLIETHKLIKQEVWEELNELNKLDLDKFSAKEKKELQQSINDLSNEYQQRLDFLSDLETLL